MKVLGTNWGSKMNLLLEDRSGARLWKHLDSVGGMPDIWYTIWLKKKWWIFSYWEHYMTFREGDRALKMFFELENVKRDVIWDNAYKEFWDE